MFAAGLRSGVHLTEGQLQDRQWNRLRRLLEHAYENVGYYRRLFDSVGFRPTHLRRPSDIAALPITTRQMLQQTPRSEFISRGFSLGKLREIRTSGATGAPLTIYRARRERWFRLLLTLRAFRRNGLRWNDRVVTISRQSTTPFSDLRFSRRSCLRRWNLCFFDSPEKQLQMILKIRPAVLYGYAPSVALLGSLLSQRGIAVPWLRLVVTSAELLIPQYRSMIKNGFGLDPIDIYNCTELGDIAWQCQFRAGFHINADWLIVEAVRRPEYLMPEGIGEFAVTSLYHFAMPLIRYSPGDFGALAEAPCRCGIGLPRLASLDGRAQTLAPLPNGRYFLGFSRIMSDFPEIKRYQIVQKALDAFIVSVVPGTGWTAEVSNRIAAALAAKIGAGVTIEVVPVDDSQLIQGPGKFRPVIPLTPGDAGAPLRI
jgi:phenylacetate-CoA ligase